MDSKDPPPPERQDSLKGPVWHTCCSKTEPEFIKYISQLVVSLVVLILAVVKLCQGSQDALYPSLLTLILGVYVPTPTHKTP
jgi:hypothetical protein